jgi:hypothetical protein
MLLLIPLIAFTADAAFACRAYQFWSTGKDLSRLNPGEIVVKAALIGSYKSEQRYEHSIMGPQYGMIYHVRLTDPVGGNGDEGLRAGSELLLRLPPAICEVYVPYNFSVGSEETLVLKKMPDGIYNLVGGRNRDDG